MLLEDKLILNIADILTFHSRVRADVTRQYYFHYSSGSHNAEEIVNAETARLCLTLEGDLGIGGGPAGLRLWLDASFTLALSERERDRWRARPRYRRVTETARGMANNVCERSMDIKCS